MNYLNTIFTNNFIHALGWTLIHSLWQIAIVAIILGLVLLALKRSLSATRYYVSAGAMLIVLLLSIITFFGEYSNAYNTETTVKNIQQTTVLDPDYSKSDNTKLGSTLKPGFRGNFIAYFDKHLPLIVLIWQMGVLILLLKLLGGLAYSQRLKSYRTHSLSEYWHNRLNELSHAIGIQKAIKLMESAIVKAPVVIGYFKPVILFPVGAIAGLSQEQVEVILAHELAHIKRNDYLVNIFQSVIEVLFFFHPAIWWISANVRNERENICDDIAISVNKDSLVLARALTSLEFLNHKTPGLAAAFAGNKGSLLNRVKRIVNQHNTLPTFKEGFITAIILIVGILVMSFSTKMIVGPETMAIVPENLMDYNTKISGIISPTSTASLNYLNKPVNVKDTIRSHTEIGFTYSTNGKAYKLVYDLDKNLKEFYIDNKKIPKKDWKNHKDEIDKAFARIKAHEKEMIKHEFEMQKHEQEMQMHEIEMQKLEKEMKIYEKKMQKHDIEMKVHDKDIQKHAEEMKIHEQEMKEHEKEMQIIIEAFSQLKKDKLIDEKIKSYEFSFKKSYLKINGKMQDKKVFEKFKYLIKQKSENLLNTDGIYFSGEYVPK